MEEKLEELREEYSQALREGDTDKATDYYWKVQEYKEEGSVEDESGSEDEPTSEEYRFEELNGVGPELAEELLEKFGSYDAFVENADKENLSSVSGIGEGRAESLLEQVNE